MDIIAAPWRREYIMGEKSTECVFCERQKEDSTQKDYILYRGKYIFIIMNIYPYNTGHIMITPYRHLPCFSDLNKEELTEFSLLSQQCLIILKTVLSPEGFNTGMNIGDVAGAGVKGHVHFHIVPRWKGDTNFMPTISKTKVLSTDLTTTYQDLLPHFKKLSIPA